MDLSSIDILYCKSSNKRLGVYYNSLPSGEKGWAIRGYIPRSCETKEISYRNDPKFSDVYAWANSADPDQTRGAV